MSDPIYTKKLRHQLNPCDEDRFAVLEAFGEIAAAMWDVFVGDTECQCCLGIRLFAALTVAAGAGYGLALLLT